MLHGVKNCVQHCSRIKSSAWREIEGNLWGLRKKLLAGLVVQFHEEKKKKSVLPSLIFTQRFIRVV